MIRERVAENVYVFTSEQYAQVNAGAVVAPDWSVVIDTLAIPKETLEIRDFLENHLKCPVRYVINTHYHADHSNGNRWFERATIVGHARCRQLMDSRGRAGLEEAKAQSRELGEVEIVLPSVVFEQGGLSLRVGKRVLELIPLPGHSPDGIGVLIADGRVLFSGDVMMPIPYLLDGDHDTMVASLKEITRLKLESVVQGHGGVILRGEINQSVRSNLAYLSAIRKEVRKAMRRRDPEGYLAGVSVESCGKNQILLNGLAEELHQRNLLALYHLWKRERN